MTTISETDFFDKYRPKPNPFSRHASWNGCMLKSYGLELAHVQEALAANPNTVWTVLDCDGALIASSGYHHVNRMGYLITEVPVADGEMVETIDDDADEEEGTDESTN